MAIQAMGNFPYPSSYILNGDGELPAWPIKVLCSHLAKPDLEGPSLLSALASGVGVFYNYSGALECFDLGGVNPDTDEDAQFWGYQWCTEMVQPFSRSGGEAFLVLGSLWHFSAVFLCYDLLWC